MKVIMFQDRFAELVRGGFKRQTIRKERKKYPIQIGDKLSLRKWKGKPYRSQQIVLGEVTCLTALPIEVGEYSIWHGAVCHCGHALDAFARADGFADFNEMRAWFERTHGLDTFKGVCITWE